MDLLQKNKHKLIASELRVFFYDTLNRAPTDLERSRIHELIHEKIQMSDISG